MSAAIDCDVHCAPPTIAALHPYLTKHWRDYLGETAFSLPAGVSYTYPAWSPLALRPADLTLEAVRRDVLDKASIAILNCYYSIEGLTHPYLARDLATAVNRWLQEEWLDRDDRLRASAVISPQLTEFAIDEIERIASDPRFVQVLVPARALELYGKHRYWPIWEAAARHGLTIGITFGGAAGTPPTPVGWVGTYFEEYALGSQVFKNQVTSLIAEGVLERYPDLRVSVLESGWTWLPSALWLMDTEWKATRRETPWVAEPPSDYVRRHFRFTTQPIDAPPTAKQLAEIVRQLGSDELLMFGSDYPRSYEPGIEELLAVLAPEQSEKVLWRNAADWYRQEQAVSATA